MSATLALSKAEDAKKMAKDASDLGHQALEAANRSLTKHEEHEKICAIRYGDFIDKTEKIDTAIQVALKIMENNRKTFQQKVFIVALAIISSLTGTCGFLFVNYVFV